jgi:hypothetical protein
MEASIEDNQLIIAEKKVLIKNAVVTRRLFCNLTAFLKLEVSLPRSEVLVTSPYRQPD